MTPAELGSDADRGDSDNDPNAIWKSIRGGQQFVPVPTLGTNATPARTECIRIVCISDTHGRHRDIALPAGDVLIHGGDWTKSGEIGTVQDLMDYFDNSGFPHVLCVAGNHEVTLQPSFYDEHWDRFHPQGKFDTKIARKIVQQSRCIYLEDAVYSVGDVQFYGSPWSPIFFEWAFNASRGKEMKTIWDKIPSTIDVLITHGPPLGRGDYCHSRIRAGCYDLMCAVQERIQPRLHIFGHIHEGYGVTFDGTTLYVNASNVDHSYQPVNLPIVIDLPRDATQPAHVVQPHCRIHDSKDFLGWLKEKDEYVILESYAVRVDWSISKSPFGNALFTGFMDLCDILGLHRDRLAIEQLRSAIGQIYSESFC